MLRPPYLFLRYFAHELKFSSCSLPSGWRDALEEVGDDSFCNGQRKIRFAEKPNYFVFAVLITCLTFWIGQKLIIMNIIWSLCSVCFIFTHLLSVSKFINIGGLECIISFHLFSVWEFFQNVNTYSMTTSLLTFYAIWSPWILPSTYAKSAILPTLHRTVR